MILAFPPLFQRLYSQQLQQQYPQIQKISSGLLIAVIETFIICPLERLKIHLMTQKKKKVGYSHSLSQVRHSLFSGLEA